MGILHKNALKVLELKMKDLNHLISIYPFEPYLSFGIIDYKFLLLDLEILSCYSKPCVLYSILYAHQLALYSVIKDIQLK